MILEPSGNCSDTVVAVVTKLDELRMKVVALGNIKSGIASSQISNVRKPIAERAVINISIAIATELTRLIAIDNNADVTMLDDTAVLQIDNRDLSSLGFMTLRRAFLLSLTSLETSLRLSGS